MAHKPLMLLVLLFFTVICVRCSHVQHQSHADVNVKFFDHEKIISLFYSGNDFIFSNLMKELISKNSTQNHQCVIELNTLWNGLSNVDRWAVQVFDAFGKLPSGLLKGNFFDFGSFRQCFHIERNGKPYETQYCIGQLKFHADDLNEIGNSVPSIMPPLDIGLGISIGICLPASCAADHLQRNINEIIRRNVSGVSVKIPKNTCQLQETVTELKSLDFFGIGALALVLFLIVVSTSYDIFCTLYKRNKYRPLLAFSFYTNGMELFSIQKPKSSDVITCLHGIRGISATWIVLGHSVFMYMVLPVRNSAAIFEFTSKYYSIVLFYSSPIAVEAFLAISGLLVSINVLRKLEKNGKLNILSLYLHRYFRLTPLLAVYCLLSMTLARFLGSGPVWPIMNEFLSGHCSLNWWSTFLYVQNYANPNAICLPHSWYLSVDMQLYIAAPFIIYLLYRWKSKAILIFLVLILGCIGLTLVLHVNENLTDLMNDKKLKIAYFPTHIRFASWLIGVMTGYAIVRFPAGSIRISNIINRFALLMSFTLMAVAIFANYPLQQPNSTATPLQHGLYDALSRVAFSSSLCYVIFACIHNSDSPVNTFLSHRLWQPVSRLSYAIYMVHFSVIIITTATMKTSPYFSELSIVHSFIGNCILTLCAAIIGMLSFEKPVLCINNLLFGSEKGKGTCNVRTGHQSKRIRNKVD